MAKQSVPVLDEVALLSTSEAAIHTTKIDLSGLPWSQLNLLATTVNTATVPYEGKNIYVHYAFSDIDILTADAPTVLDRTKLTFAVKSTSVVNAIRYFNSGPKNIVGDYLYVWVSHPRLGAGFTLSLELVECGISSTSGAGSSNTSETTQLSVLSTLESIAADVAQESTLQDIKGNLGLQDDPAITDSTEQGSAVSFLKGLTKVLSSVWDDTSDALKTMPMITDTETTSWVGYALVSTELLAANVLRKGVTIYNKSDGEVYVKHGTAATDESFKVKIPVDGYYEMPSPLYRGVIHGIWASATDGGVAITESI